MPSKLKDHAVRSGPTVLPKLAVFLLPGRPGS
jgi:hypothetical protein